MSKNVLASKVAIKISHFFVTRLNFSDSFSSAIILLASSRVTLNRARTFLRQHRNGHFRPKPKIQIMFGTTGKKFHPKKFFLSCRKMLLLCLLRFLCPRREAERNKAPGLFCNLCVHIHQNNGLYKHGQYLKKSSSKAYFILEQSFPFLLKTKDGGCDCTHSVLSTWTKA